MNRGIAWRVPALAAGLLALASACTRSEYSFEYETDHVRVARTFDAPLCAGTLRAIDSDAGPNIGAMAVGSAGEDSEDEKCECCGGPLHSDAQSRAPMTSDEFYSPVGPSSAPPGKSVQKAIVAAKQTIDGAKANGCEKLVHEDASDKCAKHYPASAKDNKAAREEYAAMMSPLTPDDYFTGKYGEKLGKEIQERGKRMYNALKGGAKSIAHRTPLTAGGCPVGEGNLQPVDPSCAAYEDGLGKVQGEIALYHRKIHGL